MEPVINGIKGISQDPQNDLATLELQTFFLVRFEALEQPEKARVLAHVLQHTAHDAHFDREEGIAAHLRRTEKWDDQRLDGAFETLVKQEGLLPQISEGLLHVYQDFFPGVLAAIDAVHHGDGVAFLTARGARDAHLPLLDAIHEFLDRDVSLERAYFVNDEERNIRLEGADTAEKKLQVIRDFLNGFRFGEDGELRVYSKQYRRVIFYDDEAKNVDLVNQFAEDHGISHVLHAVNAHRLSHRALWKSTVTEIANAESSVLPEGETLHVFDIDGTLIDAKAMIYLVHRDTREQLLAVTQEEWATSSMDSLKQRVLDENDSLGEADIDFDFGDFRLPERIATQIRPGMFKNGEWGKNSE